MALALERPTRPALRDYQTKAVDLTRRAWEDGRDRTYIALPTGTGKTVVMSQLTEQFDRVLLLAHRVELIDQLADRLRRDWGRSVGVVMGRRNEYDAELVVATPQSLYASRLGSMLGGPRFDAVFIDEAHHAVPKSRYHSILDSVATAGAEIVLGVTATPYRADRRRMQDLLPVCAFSRTIDQMQEAGWLCPFTWRRIQVDMDLSRVHTAMTTEGRDYKVDELALEAEREDVVESVTSQTVSLIGDRPTLVFGVSVRHAHLLAAAYRAAGVSAAAIWGEMHRDERVRALADWRTGRIQVITNCALLSEGFDFPEIAALVIARPTQSPSLYVQMVGRGSRTAEGKHDCLVIDISGNEPIDDSRQVILADVASVQEYEDLLDDEVGTKQPRRLSGVSGSRRLLVRDPSHDQVWRWVKGTHGYLLSATAGTMLVMLADPGDSGLYHLAALRQNGGIEKLSRQPDPLWELQRLAHDWVEANGVPMFAARGQRWHEQPATPAQIAMLRRLNAKIAGEMTDRSRVETSEMIGRLMVGRHLSQLYGVLWNQIPEATR